MEWIGSVFSTGASALSGGILGLAGGLFSRLFDWLTVKEKIKQDKARYAHELSVLQIETNRDVIIAKEEANARREVAESEALGKSYETDRATYLSPQFAQDLPRWGRGIVAGVMAFVDFVRGMTRPGLTLYLCVLTTMIYLQLQAAIAAAGGEPITREMAYGLVRLIIETVLFLTTTAVCWWFAARAKSAPQER